MALSDKAKADGRWRAQTDLFFLGRDVLHYDLEEQPHREMCGFFVAKDPRKGIYEQDGVKERQMIISRGSFKSTIDVIDSAQWIIGFPNVRILCLTGEQGLSDAFADELKNIFTVQNPDYATDFQQLFPEFCIDGRKREAMGNYVAPARTRFRKEPTFWSSSILSRLPGWHCDVLKLDDVVNPENAENPEQREKVIRRVNMARKLRDPGGYIDVIGTPFNEEDYYAYQRKHADPTVFVFIERPAGEIKAEAKKKDFMALAESDFDSFYFPTRLTLAYLQNEYRNDPESFYSQYFLDARNKVSAVVQFTDDLLDSSEVPWQSVSTFSSYYAIWDLAYGTPSQVKKNAPCLSAGGIWAKDDRGHLVLVELIAGRYNPGEIEEAIADPMARYNLQFTGIEDSPGVRWLEPGIKRVAERIGIGVPSFHWIPVDRSEDAKLRRISLVPPLLRDRMMLISDACINKEFLREQLLKYTGKKRTPRDVADMLGLTAITLGNYSLPQKQDMTEEEYAVRVKAVRDRTMREILFPSMSEPVAKAPIEEPVTNYF